jgi:hypothetical protein
MHRDVLEVLSATLPELGSWEIEKQLGRMQYSAPTLTDARAETDGFPSFLEPFLWWLGEHRVVPTPMQHLGLYFAQHPQLSNGIRPGLEARLLRAWPSLVRDYHLLALVREAGMTVTYSACYDKAGIDLTVWPTLPERPPLFVHAFVSSGRSAGFREGKLQGPRHFDLPLDPAEARVVGNVWLYQSPLHTERVRAAL